MASHYDRPGRIARAGNTVIRLLAEAGISLSGTRALRVRGRRTGKMRGVVVNVLTMDGVDYLVSPRGDTEWARNARAAGEVELGPRWRRARRVLTEVDDDAKPVVLQRYLDRWFWEVKGYVGGLSPQSGAAEFRAAAPSIPVFSLTRLRPLH